MRGKLSDMSSMALWMAGETGQVALARTADADGLRATLDQHAAEVRDALGGWVTEEVLLSYARGFVEAAVARGWWPPHRRALLAHDSLLTPRPLLTQDLGSPDDDRPAQSEEWPPADNAPSLLDDLLLEDRLLDLDADLDWESLRLAAICHLFLEARGLSL
jgi:hypothetical protein